MPASPPASAFQNFGMPWGSLEPKAAPASSASPYQVELLPRSAKNPVQDQLTPKEAPAMPASPPASAFQNFGMPWGLLKPKEAPASPAAAPAAASKKPVALTEQAPAA